MQSLLRSQPSPGLCWIQCCTNTGPEAHPALSEGEFGGLPAHPSPTGHHGQYHPGGHSLDELPSKGFQLAGRCCRCQQQVQALPRQHMTQDPQQALRGLGVIRIHGLQKKKKKNRGKRSHRQCVLQSSSQILAMGAELTGCQSLQGLSEQRPTELGGWQWSPLCPRHHRARRRGEPRSTEATQLAAKNPLALSSSEGTRVTQGQG